MKKTAYRESQEPLTCSECGETVDTIHSIRTPDDPEQSLCVNCFCAAAQEHAPGEIVLLEIVEHNWMDKLTPEQRRAIGG